MRDVINKGLTNEELLRGVKTAWDQGWRQVRRHPLQLVAFSPMKERVCYHLLTT